MRKLILVHFNSYSQGLRATKQQDSNFKISLISSKSNPFPLYVLETSANFILKGLVSISQNGFLYYTKCFIFIKALFHNALFSLLTSSIILARNPRSLKLTTAISTNIFVYLKLVYSSTLFTYGHPVSFTFCPRVYHSTCNLVNAPLIFY